MFTLKLNFEVDGRRRGRWDSGVPCGLGALFSLQRRTLDPLRHMTPRFPTQPDDACSTVAHAEPAMPCVYPR